MRWMITVLVVIALAGCDGAGRTAKLNSDGATVNEVERRVGISFPTNTVLLASSDGGGREASFQYHVWALHSPSAITVPFMERVGPQGSLTLPTKDAADFIFQLTKKKITQPQSALGSEWQTNGFKFRSTQVRATDGDYVVIQQFKK